MSVVRRVWPATIASPIPVEPSGILLEDQPARFLVLESFVQHDRPSLVIELENQKRAIGATLAVEQSLKICTHADVLDLQAGCQVQVKCSVVCGNCPKDRGVSDSRRICIVLPWPEQKAAASFIVVAFRLPSDAAGPLSSRETMYWLFPVEITPVVEAQALNAAITTKNVNFFILSSSDELGGNGEDCPWRAGDHTLNIRGCQYPRPTPKKPLSLPLAMRCGLNVLGKEFHKKNWPYALESTGPTSGRLNVANKTRGCFTLSASRPP